MTTTSTSTAATGEPLVELGPNLAVARGASPQRDLLVSAHDVDAASEDESSHRDDGFTDAELPEMPELDEDDAPAAPELFYTSRVVPMPKIRWWVDGQNHVRWSVRPPAVGSAVTSEALALHVAKLTAIADVIGSSYPAAVSASTMFDALRVFEGVPAGDLDRQTRPRDAKSDGSNLSHLRGTVIAFPWGLISLGTLTRLSPSGSRPSLVPEVLELAKYVGDPDFPERLEIPSRGTPEERELKAVRTRICRSRDVQEDSLQRVLPSLLAVLRRPSAIWALRSIVPLLDWTEATRAMIPKSGKEFVVVMAVAGAFEEQLAGVWNRTRSARR